MEQEIFDDYTWNEHKKILTADKHKKSFSFYTYGTWRSGSSALSL